MKSNNLVKSVSLQGGEYKAVKSKISLIGHIQCIFPPNSWKNFSFLLEINVHSAFWPHAWQLPIICTARFFFPSICFVKEQNNRRSSHFRVFKVRKRPEMWTVWEMSQCHFFKYVSFFQAAILYCCCSLPRLTAHRETCGPKSKPNLFLNLHDLQALTILN